MNQIRFREEETGVQLEQWVRGQEASIRTHLWHLW